MQKHEIDFGMSEQTTQKLLVATSFAFGVALVWVLVRHGNPKKQDFERFPIKSNSVAVAPPINSAPSRNPSTAQSRNQPTAPNQAFSNGRQKPKNWSPTTIVQPPRQENFAADRQLRGRNLSQEKPRIVEDYFDSTYPESNVATQTNHQHQSPEKFAQNQRPLQQRGSYPLDNRVLQTPTPRRFNDFGNVKQATAERQLSNRSSSVRQTDYEEANYLNPQRLAQSQLQFKERVHHETAPDPLGMSAMQTESSNQLEDFHLDLTEQATEKKQVPSPALSMPQPDYEAEYLERQRLAKNQLPIDDTVPNEAPRSIDKSVLQMQASNQFNDSDNVEHTTVKSQLPNQASSVRHSDFESSNLDASSSVVRIDKRVRKANWAEIEMAPTVEPSIGFSPLQQPVLSPRRASPQVEARALEQIRYGQSLTRRRSFFAAREEFIRALLLIASSYNAESNSSAHPERLAQALIAIDEASDFATFSSGTNRSTLLQQKILSHKSRLLAPQEIATITPARAINVYSNFAQSQIEQAIGFSAAGSEALHALGKLESIAPDQGRTSQTKTLVFFRAAININPSNTVCANDLGVLLYDMGHLQESETALKASLGSTQSQVGWNNLASVHRQRAASATSAEQRNYQLWLADSAAQQAQKFASDPEIDRLSSSQWATASEFQNNAAFPNVVVQNAPSRTAENTPSQAISKAAALKQKLKDWF